MQIDLELIRSIDRRLDEQKSMLIHLERQGRRDRKRRERGEIERPAGLVTRIVACKLMGLLEGRRPEAVAAAHWPHDIELKAAVAPAMTSVAGWSAELVATVIEDIASTMLGPSVLSQLRSIGAVSYDQPDGAQLRVPSHQSVPSGGFVGEGQPIAVGALLITAANLPVKKAASIVAIGREVLKGSAANVETSLQAILSEDLSMAVDTILLDANPADAIRPAGLRNGVAGLTPAAAGTPSEKIAADVGALVGAIMPSSAPVLIVAGRQAVSLGALAMPVIVAPSLAAGVVIALDGNAFASVLGPVETAASGDPVLHMESATPLPLVGGSAQPPLIGSVAAPQQSMFQTNAVSLRSLLFVNWAMRRPGSVSWMTGVTW